jgi:hypothetical protein
MTLNWVLKLCILLASGSFACKARQFSEAQTTDSLQLSGKTGRHLTLEIVDVNPSRSKTSEHRLCGIALAGDEVFNKEAARTRLVCSSGISLNQTASLRLPDVPYPAYLTVFHDENLNGALDFTSFDIVIAKKTGPMEGIARFAEPSSQTPYSKAVWAEVGENLEKLEMRYEYPPFWKVVSEQTWQYLYNLYLQKARDVNHPGRPHNPFCTRLEDCL